MRLMAQITVLAALGVSLSGCVAASVVGAAVDVTSAVVVTTVKTTGAVVGGVAHTVTGSGHDDKKSDD